MKKRITSARAIAEVLGLDLADMKECRYQPTETKQAIYSIANDYYAAGKKPTDWCGHPWQEIGSYDGKPVYRSEMITEGK